jgi:cbb3-type cytochrome oxidase maturation protein
MVADAPLSRAERGNPVSRAMDILFMLIPLSVVLALLIGAAFWWAAKNGQFDDLEGPAHRILTDDDRPH